MIRNKQVRSTRTDETSIEINAADIVELLRKAGEDIPPATTTGLRVYFAVPGGGDWSNTDIDINDRNPIRIEWKKVEEIDG